MIGIVLIGLGAAGVIAAVVMEIITQEPFYFILMKIFPLIFSVGVAIKYIPRKRRR